MYKIKVLHNARFPRNITPINNFNVKIITTKSTVIRFLIKQTYFFFSINVRNIHRHSFDRALIKQKLLQSDCKYLLFYTVFVHFIHKSLICAFLKQHKHLMLQKSCRQSNYSSELQ